MNNTFDALDAIIYSIEESGYKTNEVKIGIDAAASNFYDKINNIYNFENKKIDSKELLDYYIDIIKNYPIQTFEDPFHEDDFLNFSKMKRKLKNTIIVGDDLFVTNKKRVKIGIENQSADSILFKVNQIGSISEALDTAIFGMKNGLSIFVSHRSGETNDTIISDLSVALNANFIKAGAPSRGERISKYNRLLRIEEDLTS